jgi:hypothetical protein
MKAGMIFECGPDGADRKVCEHLARLLQPEMEIISVTLDNNPKLLMECGSATEKLLREGCKRIVIVWDLYPPWHQKGQRPCRKEDREAISRALTEAKVFLPLTSLVCIEEKLEAWLLADGRALATVLSRSAHQVKVRDIKRPELTQNPKTRLNRIFQQHSGRPYVDRIHAKKIVEALPDLTKLRRCSTFVRFAVKVTGKTP